MSNKSLPAGFERPLPVEKYYDATARSKMMATLEKRCAEVKAKSVAPLPPGDQTDAFVAPPQDASTPQATELAITPSAGGEIQSGVTPGLPPLSRPAFVSTPGALGTREDSVTLSAESSRPPALIWLPAQGEGRRTDCGHYACARITLNGRRHYELRKLVPGTALWLRIGGNELTFERVQLLAQQDADRPT